MAQPTTDARPINQDAASMLLRYEEEKKSAQMSLGIHLVIIGGIVAILGTTIVALTAANVIRPAYYNPSFINTGAWKANIIIGYSLAGGIGLIAAGAGAYNIRAVIIKQRQANVRDLSPSAS